MGRRAERSLSDNKLIERRPYMLPMFITIIVLLAAVILWAISTQRKLVVLDENTRSAMSQIGVQLSGRFDSLRALLDLSKGYAGQESELLIESIKSGRSVITAKSTPDDVMHQELIISYALSQTSLIEQQYPALKADPNYVKAMDAVETFESMVRTSRLLYNDSITKRNRQIRMFPTCIIAGILGFPKGAYLEERTIGANGAKAY